MAHDASSRSARARFQSGLLAWLRQPADASGLREMIAVLRELALSDTISGDGVLWRSAEAFLASLLDSSLKADDDARQMCRRIERHLAANARGEAVVDEDLRAALFAFVSGRSSAATAAATTAATTTDDPAWLLAGLQKAMGNSLARTAEILPLIAGAVRPRHSEQAVGAWLDAAKAVDRRWHAFARGNAGDCRQATTALVAAALVVNAPAALQLAEALASACACGEETAAREHPALRAAIAAALEIAGDRDGPNHPHFDQRATLAAARLAKAESQTLHSVRLVREASRPAPDETPAAADVENFSTLR